MRSISSAQSNFKDFRLFSSDISKFWRFDLEEKKSFRFLVGIGTASDILLQCSSKDKVVSTAVPVVGLIELFFCKRLFDCSDK
jgi:hypothetical protein